MTDYRALFDATAKLPSNERKPMSFAQLFTMVDAPKLAALPWEFGSVPFEMHELASNPQRYREQNEVGCCIVEDRFYLGLFRKDGSAAIASMPAWMADGLAHFIHYDLCGAPRPGENI